MLHFSVLELLFSFDKLFCEWKKFLLVCFDVLTNFNFFVWNNFTLLFQRFDFFTCHFGFFVLSFCGKEWMIESSNNRSSLFIPKTRLNWPRSSGLLRLWRIKKKSGSFKIFLPVYNFAGLRQKISLRYFFNKWFSYREREPAWVYPVQLVEPQDH